MSSLNEDDFEPLRLDFRSFFRESFEAWFSIERLRLGLTSDSLRRGLSMDLLRRDLPTDRTVFFVEESLLVRSPHDDTEPDRFDSRSLTTDSLEPVLSIEWLRLGLSIDVLRRSLSIDLLCRDVSIDLLVLGFSLLRTLLCSSQSPLIVEPMDSDPKLPTLLKLLADGFSLSIVRFADFSTD